MKKKNPTKTSVKNSSSSRLKQRVSESYYHRAVDYFLADDFRNAYYWANLATRFHHPEAEWLVGHLLLSGDGCQKNISKAVHHLTKASRKGVAFAKYELGSCYYLGEGVQRDVSTFIKLIKGAAKKGVPAAAEALAQAYRDGEGIQKNYKLAVKWFHVAAENGLPESMYCLYVRYSLGQGVDRNMSEAMEWLIKGAEAGHAICQRVLGEAYYHGDGGLDVDKLLAFEWCMKAAQQGDAEANYCVGLNYLNGDGVEANPKMAQHWLRVAARQNYSDAQLDLARSLFRENTKSSCEEGLTWLRRAANLKNAEAQLGLGMMLSTGAYGAPMNVEDARYWYQQALENGEQKAQWYLERLP